MVIVAYNEEGLVGPVIDDVPAFVDAIYVVDDCSRDGTWDEILRRIESEGPESETDRRQAAAESAVAPMPDGGVVSGRLTAVRHDSNRGVGGAIKTGYRLARQAELDVTAVVNGDGQMDPAMLGTVLDPVVDGVADYAKGNRLAAPDLYAEMSRWRLFGNVLLTMLTRVASGYLKMNDSQNGYTAVSLAVLQDIDLDGLYDRYGFLNDVLITLNSRGFRVADVPMKANYGDETSGIRYRTFVPRLSYLLASGFAKRLAVRYVIDDFHPLVFLYPLAVVGFLGGISFGALSLALRRPLLAAGLGFVILLLSGSLWVLAMTLDMYHNEQLVHRVGS